MYKHTILIIYFLVLATVLTYSQNHIEALRYSQQFYSSSAKSEAMGNSLSAVGADFSAYNTNPAGIAIFKGKQFAFTPNFIVSNTTSNFSNNENKDGRIGFNFSNAGYVLVHKTNGILKSFNLGIAYNSFNDFRERSYVTASNQQASLLDYLTYNANNDRYNDFREDLAYETYLLEFDNDNDEYYNRVTDYGKYGNSQTKSISTKGGGGEFSFTLGFNINDILYLGGTIGLTSINYTMNSTYSEAGFEDLWFLTSPTDSTLVNPNSFKYKETLETEGSGINAKFGFIFQPIKMLRFGGAIHSGTAYDFKDYYKASMHSDFPTPDENDNYDYDAEAENVFDWRLTTPFRANAGIAIILDAYKIGNYYTTPMTFSFDYEYVDYRRAFLRDVEGGDYSFSDENNNIESFYSEVHNLRAGAEFNFGFIKLRGGYAIYSNPLQKSDIFSNAKMIYSGGIGFAKNAFYVDASYSYSPTTQVLNLYGAADVFPNNPMGGIMEEPKASLSNTKQFFKLTFGFRL